MKEHVTQPSSWEGAHSRWGHRARPREVRSFLQGLPGAVLWPDVRRLGFHWELYWTWVQIWNSQPPTRHESSFPIGRSSWGECPQPSFCVMALHTRHRFSAFMLNLGRDASWWGAQWGGCHLFSLCWIFPASFPLSGGFVCGHALMSEKSLA